MGVDTSDVEIGWNIIRDSTANRAIQLYSHGAGVGYFSDINIHDNLFYDIRGNAINLSSYFTGIIKVYNNIIYKAGLGPDFAEGMTSYTGVLVSGGDYGNNDAVVYLYNNVIYNCGYSGHPDSSGSLTIGSNYTGT